MKDCLLYRSWPSQKNPSKGPVSGAIYVHFASNVPPHPCLMLFFFRLLRTPLMEKMSLADAGLKDGEVLVLEDGLAPKPGQITLSFATASSVQEAEIIVEKVKRNEIALELGCTVASFCSFV